MLEGVMLKRRYRLDRVIGGGAAGAVFRAMDLRLNREVAVKILRPGLGAAWLAAGPERSGIARWAELRHPNVLTLHEFGIEETLGWNVHVPEHGDGPAAGDDARGPAEPTEPERRVHDGTGHQQRNEPTDCAEAGNSEVNLVHP